MKTMLLLEADAFSRANAAELLGLAGYAGQPAENGRVGLALALATKPDLVLCDSISTATGYWPCGVV